MSAMSDDTHSLRSGSLTATVKAHGAELCSLKDDFTEFVWQAGPEWPRHAPLLFPIVGRLAGDELRHRGKSIPDDPARLCARQPLCMGGARREPLRAACSKTARRRARSIRSRSG